MTRKIVLGFIRQHKWLFYAGVIVVPVISQLLFMSMILLYTQITNVALGQARMGSGILIFVCILYIIALLLFQYGKERASVTFRSGLAGALKERFGQHLVTMKAIEAEKSTLGRTMETYQNIEGIVRLPEMYVSIVISALQLSLLSLYVVYEINWKMLLVLAVLVALTIGMSMLANPLRQKQHRIVRAEEKVIDLSSKISSGIEIIKSYAKETFFARRYGGLTEEQARCEVEAGQYETGLNITNKLLTFIILVAAPFLAITFASDKSNLEGIIISMSFIYGFMAQSFSTLLGNIQQLKSLKVSGELMDDFLQKPLTSPAEDHHLQETAGEWRLEASGLHFAYPNQPQEVIRGVSMDVPQTGLTVLVGESGSGKSTLLKVLGGVYEETQGEFRDNSGGYSLSPAHRQGMMSYTPQETWLLPGSVADNIASARIKDTESIGQGIIDTAPLTGLLDQFPAGPQTAVEQGGSNLSGGQKQLVALLRGLNKEADVFLFDEPTSAQAAGSEEVIFQVLTELAGRKSVIVATHRLRIAQEADYIYVLENGKIAEQGTHLELMAQSGKYRQLFQYEKWQEA